VARLQVAWTYPSGQTDFNPLVVRGVIYGRGPNDSFVAVDAATGKEIWAQPIPARPYWSFR
jgi:quinoprotein glucose dehydrogenase